MTTALQDQHDCSVQMICLHLCISEAMLHSIVDMKYVRGWALRSTFTPHYSVTPHRPLTRKVHSQTLDHFHFTAKADINDEICHHPSSDWLKKMLLEDQDLESDTKLNLPDSNVTCPPYPTETRTNYSRQLLNIGKYYQQALKNLPNSPQSQVSQYSCTFFSQHLQNRGCNYTSAGHIVYMPNVTFLNKIFYFKLCQGRSLADELMKGLKDVH